MSNMQKRLSDQRLELAASLLDIGAVVLSPNNPFTWASGLKSPIYCDNRTTLGFPDLRNTIAAAFHETIVDNQLKPESIAGTATAGIPHASILATRMDLPMCYVRSSAKTHGRKNIIEGPLAPGTSVVIVEDLVSTGMSSLRAVSAVREAECPVEAVLSIFTYALPAAQQAFESDGVALFSLTDYNALLDVAIARETITSDEYDMLKSWRSDPAAWGGQNS